MNIGAAFEVIVSSYNYFESSTFGCLIFIRHIKQKYNCYWTVEFKIY